MFHAPSSRIWSLGPWTALDQVSTVRSSVLITSSSVSLGWKQLGKRSLHGGGRVDRFGSRCGAPRRWRTLTACKIQQVIEMSTYLITAYKEGDVGSALNTMLQKLQHARNGVDVVLQSQIRTHNCFRTWL